MEHNTAYGPAKCLHKRDPKGAFDECLTVFEGSIRTHGQEHFYMEPSSCVMRPSGEVGEIEVFMGFQFLSILQVVLNFSVKISLRFYHIGSLFQHFYEGLF